ncbi:MAG: MBOAT family O-acyltransferase [Lachnospiraceae bacterium]|nr:MBOAT family O-acyltransferase [Lachnospiraceae bacterium]
MVFSSIPFLFFFLPLCLLLYYAVPFSMKNGILLVFSLIFYAWGEPIYILLMLFATLVDYTNGLLMERFGTPKITRTLFLCSSIVVNLSVLAFFKYADFLIINVNGLLGTKFSPLGLGLPVGISFFTFQTMSYIIDLYRKEVETEHNYFTYLTYVSMFPQLVAGPIVRFSDINAELHKRTLLRSEIEAGLLRFMQGLFKKVLIANQVGALWEELRIIEASQISVTMAWIGAVCFTLQLYFDFSAYSDMAIGMGWMLGFHFNENFNYPLSSISVTDFWRRWHISLSTWFRDYVYIPLGGNRKGVLKQLRNMAVVWFLTGLWHGAAWNFVLWGIYYGILLAFEKFVWGKGLAKLPKLVQHLYALLIVVFGFVIFTFDDMAALRTYLTSMLGMAGNPLFGTEVFWYLGNYGVVLIASCILAFPVYPWLKAKISCMGTAVTTITSALSMLGYMALFLLATAYLVNDTYNPFLYFRF